MVLAQPIGTGVAAGRAIYLHDVQGLEGVGRRAGPQRRAAGAPPSAHRPRSHPPSVLTRLTPPWSQRFDDFASGSIAHITSSWAYESCKR